MKQSDWDKISDEYYDQIISPIKDFSGTNPFLEDLRNIHGKTKTVIDLGCGIGEIIPLLSEQFKAVTAIDYSNSMIEKALKRNKNLENVTLQVADMKDLKNYHSQFDFAVSVNSILASSFKTLDKIIDEVYAILKPGGNLLAIIPAMESYLYQAMLIMDNEMKNGKTPSLARKKASQLIKPDEHDFLQGMIEFGGEKQKAQYRFEVLYRFKKVGFTNLTIDKVSYSWNAWKKAGQAYFPKEDPPWDWYLRCQK